MAMTIQEVNKHKANYNAAKTNKEVADLRGDKYLDKGVQEKGESAATLLGKPSLLGNSGAGNKSSGMVFKSPEKPKMRTLG